MSLRWRNQVKARTEGSFLVGNSREQPYEPEGTRFCFVPIRKNRWFRAHMKEHSHFHSKGSFHSLGNF